MGLHSIRVIAALVILGSLTIDLAAQLSFEVATIRPSKSLAGGGTMGPKPGRFFAANVPAIAFITFGHNLKRYQVAGVPDWASTDRYNLEATTGGQAGIEQLREMMRSLLAERFQLRAHREMRQIDGYALVRMSADKLGPSIGQTTLNCADPKAVRPQGTRFSCGITFGPGTVTAGDITMAVLADILAGDATGQYVVDRTGLSGRFDLELKWAPDLAPSDLPSIFTAVQEQLGLKLERDQLQTDVLVIDRFERPSEN
jgi:bla regulator protein blaR1